MFCMNVEFVSEDCSFFKGSWIVKLVRMVSHLYSDATEDALLSNLRDASFTCCF